METAKCCVMVVDDDPIALMIHKNLLECLGYLVVTISDAAMALKQLELQPCPNFIITDIDMPGMNGIELTKYIYEKEWRGHIIGVTGHNEKALNDECIEAGMLAVITKPLKESDLNKLLGMPE